MVLCEMEPVCLAEQDFCVKFFHLTTSNMTEQLDKMIGVRLTCCCLTIYRGLCSYYDFSFKRNSEECSSHKDIFKRVRIGLGGTDIIWFRTSDIFISLFKENKSCICGLSILKKPFYIIIISSQQCLLTLMNCT